VPFGGTSGGERSLFIAVPLTWLAYTGADSDLSDSLSRTFVNKGKKKGREASRPLLLNSLYNSRLLRLPPTIEMRLSAFINLPTTRYEPCRANLSAPGTPACSPRASLPRFP
jgi:hypothetical protein